MKRILNLIKNNIFGFIIGIVVASSVSVIAATVYYSNQVSYTPTDTTWNVENVKDALDELRSIETELTNLKNLGDATANEIVVGKTAVVNGQLVTGTLEQSTGISSFNVYRASTSGNNYRDTYDISNVKNSLIVVTTFKNSYVTFDYFYATITKENGEKSTIRINPTTSNVDHTVTTDLSSYLPAKTMVFGSYISSSNMPIMNATINLN